MKKFFKLKVFRKLFTLIIIILNLKIINISAKYYKEDLKLSYFSNVNTRYEKHDQFSNLNKNTIKAYTNNYLISSLKIKGKSLKRIVQLFMILTFLVIFISIL